jgi:hypothetical protein
MHFNQGGVFWRQGQPDAASWGAWQQFVMAGTQVGDYIWNQSVNNSYVSGQSANFDITGNAEIGGGLEVAGPVGIGTYTPSQDLEVAGTALVHNRLTAGRSSQYDTDGSLIGYGTGRNVMIIQTSDNTQDRGLAFRNSGGAYSHSIYVENAGSNNGDLVFTGGTANSTITSLTELMRLEQNGDVNIGASATSAGDLYIPDRIVDWDATGYYLDPNSVSRMAEIQLDDGTAADPKINFDGDPNTGLYQSADNEMAITNNGSASAVFESDGDLDMESGRTIKMIDNLAILYDIVTYNNDDDGTAAWRTASDWSSAVKLESDNILAVHISFNYRITNGSNDDNLAFRIAFSKDGGTTVHATFAALYHESADAHRGDWQMGSLTGWVDGGIGSTTNLKFALQVYTGYSDDNIEINNVFGTGQLY